MTVTNYRNGGTFQQEPERKIGQIVQLDKENMTAKVQVRGEYQEYTVNLSIYTSSFAVLPFLGQQWIICKVFGEWALERHTGYQNPTTNLFREDFEPGDIGLTVQGKLRVSGDVSFTEGDVSVDSLVIPVQTEIFTRTQNLSSAVEGVSFSFWTRDNINSIGDTMVSMSGGDFTFLKSGRYSIHADVTVPIITTGRSYVELISNVLGMQTKRSSFALDNRGSVLLVGYIPANSIVRVGCLQTYSSSQLATATTQITRLA